VSGFIHSPAGSSGKSIATFSGAADLGAGVSTISYSLEVEVTHRMATNLGVGVGEAETSQRHRAEQRADSGTRRALDGSAAACGAPSSQ
jgi:hypothetical protein